MPGADRPGEGWSPRIAAILLTFLLAHLAGALPDRAADHAVVLVYHHVSERTPASTSVTPEVFERHLDYLARNDFKVLSLSEVVKSLAEGRPLPPRTVALTFDDGYASVYQEALPRLERRGWPLAVFVAPDAIDRGSRLFMSWDQLRDLERRGGQVGNHSTGHEHLIRRQPGETEPTWRQRVREDIVRAQARLEAELDQPLKMVAYPYGEFDDALASLVKELGFVGLGQQSGPVGPLSSPQQLPRFPVATGFDDLQSLGEKLRTRPLPVTVLSPASPILAPRSAPPVLRLRVSEGPYRRDDMRCFVSGQAAARIEWEGSIAVVRAHDPLGPGRSKYNCTAPSSEEGGVYFWYSHLWIQPSDDGRWYSE